MMQSKIAVLVNTQARSKKAFYNWQKFQRDNKNIFSCADIKLVNHNEDFSLTQNWVMNNLRQGIKKFISVGGDGTLNVLLNLLIKNSQGFIIPLEELTLGAIGLGSSNDFHKPQSIKQAEFPCRINFENTALKDIMYCSSLEPENNLRFFIINASIGITAQANHLFNFPPPWLSLIKKTNTNLAILCSGLYTIFSFRNLDINLAINKNSTNSLLLTNLAAVKNRHFAGFFRYDQGAESHNDYFMLHLCKNMRMHESVRTLLNLACGRFTGLDKTQSLLTKNISLTSDRFFCVELDGEVIRSRHCEIGVHHQKIRLCL